VVYFNISIVPPSPKSRDSADFMLG